MSEEHGNRKEQDESISDALSTLGWIEESDEEEQPLKEEDDLSEQLNFFIEQNKQLNDEILDLKKQLGEILNEKENLLHEKEKVLTETEKNNDTIENLLQSIVQKDDLIKDLEQQVENISQKVQNEELQTQNNAELQDLIATKTKENEALALQLKEKEALIQTQMENIAQLDNSFKESSQNINELNKTIETLKKQQTTSVEMAHQLQQKEEKVKELVAQIEYLEKDTIQKSKFEKLKVLVDKKDEILTEKEKTIFELQNIIEKSNQKTKELHSQIETFSLMKKDLSKKEDRIKELVLEVEKLTQKIQTNEGFLKRMEEKLEESQQKSGNITGKFELELANLRTINDDQRREIKELSNSQKQLKDKLYEAEQIEDRILTEMQKIKDEKLKLTSNIEKKDEEIVDLKKKIKLLRRDLKKT